MTNRLSEDDRDIPENERNPEGAYDDPDALRAEQRGRTAEDDGAPSAQVRGTPENTSRMRSEELSARRYDNAHHQEGNAPLLADMQAGQLRAEWETVQAAFVDDPKRAVEEADHLVARTMAHLTETFSHERANLEQQWGRGVEASTEDLRQALQRYRSFFQRLLSV